jgi:ferric-dicitrate binding protein FerR (iron transport regulator)
VAESRVPDFLTLRHHRDLEGRERRPVARRIALGLLTAILVLALLNVFGQRPETDVVDGAVAELKIYSPTTLRSGLFYESRFTIRAHEEIENATLVLDPGWLEGMTLNTLEPVPAGEANRNGRIALELGHIPAGALHRFFLHFQVNPTNVAFGRAADVELHDGERLLLHVDRTVTVFP